MTAAVIIQSDLDRERAAKWCRKAPYGMTVTFKEKKRSIPQNDLMWTLLSDVSAQKKHMGNHYAPDVWKCLFMHAMGKEFKFIPALDGSTVLPMRFSSSELSKGEMSDLIEFIYAWGAQNGVVFHQEKIA